MASPEISVGEADPVHAAALAGMLGGSSCKEQDYQLPVFLCGHLFFCHDSTGQTERIQSGLRGQVVLENLTEILACVRKAVKVREEMWTKRANQCGFCVFSGLCQEALQPRNW